MKKYARFVREHVWGPTGSVLFHLFVFGLLVRYLVIERKVDTGSVTIVLEVVSPPLPLDQIVPIDQEELDVTEVIPGREIPELTAQVEPPMPNTLEKQPSPEDYSYILGDDSPVKLPGMYTQRMGDNRKRALADFGDEYGPETEAAVMRALHWLKAHQYPDGSWGPQYRAAMTGLAVLTFLAHGETTGSEMFGDTVRDGLQYLLRRQDADGWIVGGGPHVPVPQLRVYEHVIATYALAEAYTMTRIPMLVNGLEDAVQIIIDGQLENGGWSYGFALDGPMQIDVSLGGWIIQALKAAELAEVQNRGLSMAIESGVRGISSMRDPDGSGLFSYSHRVPGHAPDVVMTGVAVLAMQLTGNVRAEAARSGLRTLQSLEFFWQNVPTDTGNHRQRVGRWPLYAWYYITQARFQHNRESWRNWNRRFAPGMSRIQNPDGSWCPPPGSIEAGYGPVYATALPALMLQVYYRLLPTYQPIPLSDALTLTDSLGGENAFKARLQ